jgi:hypothetical protein
MEIIQDGVLVAGLDENGEFFARSFMVVNADGDTVAHLTSDGDLVLDGEVDVGDTENGHVLYPDGTWSAFQDGEVVAGVDGDGEMFARSFYVLNAAGDTVAHIRGDGKIEAGRVVVTSGGETTDIQPGSVTTGNSSGSTTQSGDGISVTGSSGGVSISPNGTWTATQNDTAVAGLDSNGELFAKSFYVKDPATGDTMAHITSEGQFLGPDGEPIGGGTSVQDSVFDSEVYAKSFVVTPDGTMESAVAHLGSDGSLQTGGVTDGVTIFPDGTWIGTQGAEIVAGLDSNGEVFARSFYVKNADGDTVAHIRSDGTISQGSGSSGNTFFPDGGWETFFGGQPVAGVDENGEIFAESFMVIDPETGDTLAHLTNTGDLEIGTPNTPTGATGTRLGTDGTLGVFQSGNPILDVALDTYLRLYTCMWMGEFLWGFDPSYVFLNGNLMVNGFFSSENYPIGMPPGNGDNMEMIAGEDIEPGTVLVLDPDSDALRPCYESAQTSVIGVRSPYEGPDDNGKQHVITYGSNMILPPEEGESETVEVPIKIKVDASYGPIKRGDLLTTSATVGYAMHASDPKLGTIVGKALESLASGRGEIKVMVTLN